jgi:hypothetical protein
MNNLDLYEIEDMIRNPKIEPEILDQLIEHKHSYVKILVLRHPNTSLKTLNKILDSVDYVYCYMKDNLEAHPNANEELILKCRAKVLSSQIKT